MSNTGGFGDTFKNKMAEFKQLKESLPKTLGTEAVNSFKDSFTNQGFDGKKWQEVKRRIPGTPEYKYPKTKGVSRRTKPILSGTGKLKRDVQLKTATFDNTVVGTSSLTSDYASVHNEGKGDTPQRKFIGGSKALNNKMMTIIKKKLDELFKK